MVRGWVVWLAIWGLVIGAGAAMGAVIADNFSDPAVSKLLWKPEIRGTGVKVAEANGALQVTICGGHEGR